MFMICPGRKDIIHTCKYCPGSKFHPEDVLCNDTKHIIDNKCPKCIPYLILNLTKEGIKMTDLHDLNTRNDKPKPLTFNEWFLGKDYRAEEEQNGKVMLRFWECYVEGSNGGKHYKHWTLQSAQTEAERLARLSGNQGKNVYLFEVAGVCKVSKVPVEWYIP